MKRFLGFLLLAASALVYAGATQQQATAAPQWELSLTASPVSYAGKCPALIHLTGLIKLNSWLGAKPVNVNYSLLNSDGIDSALMHGTIASVPGSLTVTDARTPSVNGAYWVKIHLHLGGPAGDLYSDPARFTVRCSGISVGVINPNATPTPCPVGVRCHPNATPTPCPPSAAGIPCNPTPKPTTTPCPPNPAGIPCNKLPDLTSGAEIIVGGAIGGGPLPSGVVGHHVPWGGSVVLSDKDAFSISNGRCAFNISYVLGNIGPVNAGPPATFKDVIRAGIPPGGVVSIQSALTQAALTHRNINTQAYLPAPGPYLLSLTINDGHLVTESNYANNYFTIKYTLDTDKCMGHQ